MPTSVYCRQWVILLRVGQKSHSEEIDPSLGLGISVQKVQSAETEHINRYWRKTALCGNEPDKG